MKLNVYDDLEYLFDSDFFHKQKNKLFDMDDVDEERLLEGDTRNYRKKIIVETEDINLDIQTIDPRINEFFDLTHENLEKHNNELREEYSVLNQNNLENKSEKRTNSTCSSRTSNTSNGEEELSDEASGLESCENSQLSEYSSLSEENIYALIKNFPVQIICLEKMENTLDSLLEEDDDEESDDEKDTLSNKEWASCLFQIIMILITYQKIFDFTHNDLHTNNIMFQKTDRKFMNYKFNNTYYRVPTYGRIYKIIDFGRAIYSFNGKTICSDSYHPKGDAATQYNFEPYFNEKKPRLKPNKSFDLCRLACSLYDFFVDDVENENKIKNPV